jgi:hypothetical protein
MITVSSDKDMSSAAHGNWMPAAAHACGHFWRKPE